MCTADAGSSAGGRPSESGGQQEWCGPRTAAQQASAAPRHAAIRNPSSLAPHRATVRQQECRGKVIFGGKPDALKRTRTRSWLAELSRGPPCQGPGWGVGLRGPVEWDSGHAHTATLPTPLRSEGDRSYYAKSLSPPTQRVHARRAVRKISRARRCVQGRGFNCANRLATRRAHSQAGSNPAAGQVSATVRVPPPAQELI